MTTIVTIDMGGTGATHAAGAREALSVPSMTDMGQSYAQANSARDQANTARGNANDAYSQANTAYSQANSARDQANTAYGQANSARSDANTTFATINTTFGTVNTNYQAAYAQANTARTTANDAYSAANTKLASAGGTLSGDLIITGNLTVSGNQTILNTEVLTTEDADIILLSNTSSTPALNAGLIINRGTSTNTFLRWDEATDKWGWSDSGTTTYYFEDLRQGLSTTNTTFGTINTSLGTINTNYQAAYSQANTAGTNALNAYGQANTARDTANSAYGQANAAYSQANSAYGAANNRVLKAGDTMTGQLNISSGGLLVTGNVGFGTASPSAKLHILTGSNKNILFKDASHTTLTTDLGSAITFSRPSDGSNDLSGIFSWNNGGLVLSSRNEMIFATGGTGSYSNSIETMRITRNDAGTGNVGIGTTSPIFPLQVKTNTGTPPQALQLNTTDWTTTIGSAFQFGFGAATGNTYSEIRALSGGYNAWNNLVLQSGGGNVGIGTTSPGTTLAVNGTISFVPSVGNIVTLGNDGTYGTSGTGRYVTLGLSGSADTANRIFAHNTGQDGMYICAATGQSIFLRPNGNTTSSFMAAANGNVGIGTTSPSNKLHVYGSIRAGIAGNSNANYAALEVASSGTADGQAAIAIQQVTSEGDTIIFADYEPHVEWGISTENGSNLIQFTAGSGTNSLGSKTIYNRSGDARTAHTKFQVNLSDGTTLIGGNVGIGTANPATKLNVLVGAGTANGTAGIRIGGVGNYESLELGIVDNYGAMFRSYGNDMHYYSGHWKTVGNGASEDHAHYWYTSKTGSANWSTAKLILDADGALKPGADNTYNLGTSSLRWANIHTADLNMSNKGSQNDIDGTWGEWTIQEGEEDLFLLNRRNGKKFKFLLKEIE